MNSENLGLPARLARFNRYLQELWRRRQFAITLGMGNLRARNASTVFGLVWWVVNPLLLGGVYFLVFGVIFPGRRPPDFLAYLVSGMFVFHYTSSAMTGGAASILTNSKLLVNVAFPRMILPISALVESGVGFLASIGLFLVVMLPTDLAELTPALLLLPLVFILQSIFNVGLASLVARLAVPFRDINNLIPYINRIWLYLSPIIWPLTFLENAEAWQQTVMKLNPMFPFLSVYRAALLGGSVDWTQLSLAAAWTGVVGVVGVGLFVREEGNMVRYL